MIKGKIFIATQSKFSFSLAVIAFVVAAICVSMIVITMWFENFTVSLINSYITRSLNQVSYSADFMCEVAKSLALQVHFDPDSPKLLYSYPTDMQQISVILRRMQHFHATSPYVNSIYFYDTKNKIFFTDISGEMISKHSNFFDTGAKEIVDNYSNYPILKPIPRSVEDTVQIVPTNKYVYSFMFYETSKTESDPSSIIIVNVSYEWMHSIINSLSSNKGSDLFVVDRNGTLITGSSRSNMLDDVSSERYIRQVLDSERKDGYFIDQVNGVKSVVTYVSSDILDWKYVMVTPYKDVTSQLTNARLGIYAIGAILILLYIFLSFAFSHRLHKPIDDIRLKLNALRHKSDYQRKQQYLRELLEGEAPVMLDKVNEKFNKLNIRLSASSPMFVILYEIDFFNDFCANYNPEDRNLFKYGISNIASELGGEKFLCEPVELGGGTIALICNYNNSNEDFTLIVGAFLASVQESVAEHLNISLSAAVSSVGNSAEDIAVLYREALDASNYRLFYGHKSRIFYEETELRKDCQYSYPYDKEKKMSEFLLSGKAELAYDVYLDIISGAAGIAYDSFNLTVMRLDMALQSVIDQLVHGIKLDMRFDNRSFINHINTRETVDEINTAFFNVFRLITEAMEDYRNNKHHALISQVTEIIEKNFSDPEFTINSIAEEVGLTPAYLGRLFKKLTGKTISDFINMVRLRNAKQMLSETNYSIVEISEKTGFSNSTYFYTVFKKTQGITPNEYRQQAKRID